MNITYHHDPDILPLTMDIRGPTHNPPCWGEAPPFFESYTRPWVEGRGTTGCCAPDRQWKEDAWTRRHSNSFQSVCGGKANAQVSLELNFRQVHHLTPRVCGQVYGLTASRLCLWQAAWRPPRCRAELSIPTLETLHEIVSDLRKQRNNLFPVIIIGYVHTTDVLIYTYRRK